ncbi:MAG TPA: DUF742 domain-containing protein [Kineosporiaceae bacterium]|nr:DUF742 domain-containing protein [Kineosporiaceae bacterium]
MIPPWQQPEATTPGAGSHRPAPGARHAGPPDDGSGSIDLSGFEDDAAEDLVIRPFLLTGGRTRPAREGLRVEALIQARPDALRGNLRFEARQIVELCQRPISVAELAAALHVPLGVARVLVSDLMADDLVTLVQREELSVQLIERIRDRVRAL